MLSLLALCAAGREEHLLAELAAGLPGSASRPAGPGLVWTDVAPPDVGATPTLAFARQALPDPRPVAASSVAAWGRAAASELITGLDAPTGNKGAAPAPWRLHVFGAPPPGASRAGAPGAAPGLPVGPGRARLVRAAILAELRRRRRRLERVLVTDDGLPFSGDERVAQLVLTGPESGWLSIASAAQRQRLRRCLSRFPGGDVAVPEDRRPPSRAYRKLLEAERRSGLAIGSGEHCVDLGASPGSWTWVALQRGARVLAVDRSPLRDDLMRHPRLRFQRGDAFRFDPSRPLPGAAVTGPGTGPAADPPLPLPVDWLLCDVIAFPARTLELIERWVGDRPAREPWCRRFVVTVKFKGASDYPLLERLKALLDRAGAEFALCQLAANKNEVTAWGSVPPAS